MIRKLLCYFDFHKWRYAYIGPWNGWSQHVQRTCIHCGRYEGVELINPLSGPVKE